MHDPNRENDSTSYPSVDKGLIRARGKGNSEVEVLELEANEDRIEWKFLEGTALGDQITPRDRGHADLELSPLMRETIDFLVDHVQFLAEVNRSVPYKETQKEEISDTLERLIKILGRHLYNVLFKGRIQDKLKGALEKGDLGLLRVDLKLEHNKKLASWPWEYLYQPLDEASGAGVFLAEHTELVLNRRLDVTRRIGGTPQPVRVLLVVSRPQAKGLGKVQCDLVLREIRKLQEEKIVDLRDDLVDAVEFSQTCQPKGTFQNFGRAIAEFKPNIIHFIGHGRRTREGGQVAFVKGGGEPDWINGEEFAERVALCKHLKLVFLQSCESARVAPYGMSMAMDLARREIPAVVAMQDKVENGIASTFACSFYEALACGLSIDQAVKEGREEVNNLGHLHHAFGVPVLYLSSNESLIVQEQISDPQASDLLRDPSSRIGCPECKTVIAGTSRVCNECGLHFYCRFCNYKLDNPLSKFCDDCGERIRCEQCGKNYRDSAESPCCSDCRSRTSAVESGEMVQHSVGGNNIGPLQ